MSFIMYVLARRTTSNDRATIKKTRAHAQRYKLKPQTPDWPKVRLALVPANLVNLNFLN